MSGMPCGIRSIFASGTPYTSRRNVRPRSVITATRADSSHSWVSTRRWSAVGSFRTVCRVVTTGIRRPRTRPSTWLPAGPPKIPYSCWRETTSAFEKFRKSAAWRYVSRSCSRISNRTSGG
jgi:hypothetical protein